MPVPPAASAPPPALDRNSSMDAPAPKREAILEAATRVFLAQGYGGASMDLVAKEAGAARRTVYNQFESKEALFGEVVQRIWRRFPVVEITSDAAVLSDPELGLTRLGQAVADFWAPPLAVAFLRLVIAEGPRFPELARNFFEAGKAPAMRTVVAYLQELDRRGVLAVDDPGLAAKQFLGLINEPLLWARVVGIGESATVEERAHIVARAVAMFLAHYRPYNSKCVRRDGDQA